MVRGEPGREGEGGCEERKGRDAAKADSRNEGSFGIKNSRHLENTRHAGPDGREEFLENNECNAGLVADFYYLTNRKERNVIKSLGGSTTLVPPL